MLESYILCNMICNITELYAFGVNTVVFVVQQYEWLECSNRTSFSLFLKR